MEVWMVILSACVMYAGSSVFFHHFPLLLHTKKPLTFMKKLRHISHRGGSGERPENTLCAFRNALAQGTEMLELDVHLTKDEQVVVFHDQNFLRLTGDPRRIDSLNYSELPTKFKQNIEIPFISGVTLDTTQFDIHYPTLEEIFQIFPDTPINIDLKIPSDKLIEKVHSLIKAYKRESSVIWGSFIDTTCQKCYQLNPDIPIMFSFKRVVLVTLSFWAGILPFIPLKESFLEIPMFDPNLFKTQSWKVTLAIRLLDLVWSKRFFQHLNKRGIVTFSWVQNSLADFDYCIKNKGVNGIMTDRPELLTSYFVSLDQETKAL